MIEFFHIANLQEARAKANKALMLSDLSTNEDDNIKKRKKSIFVKKMSSPPALNELPSITQYRF